MGKGPVRACIGELTTSTDRGFMDGLPQHSVHLLSYLFSSHLSTNTFSVTTHGLITNITHQMRMKPPMTAQVANSVDRSSLVNLSGVITDPRTLGS